MTTSYLELLANNKFSEKLDVLSGLYTGKCMICPVECGVRRENGDKGFCGAASDVLVSSWNIHNGEEPPISGYRGSGTIFFSGCNLKCVYCQNYPISQLLHGRDCTVEELADMMLRLQKRGAHNINVVTPTHFTFQIAKAIEVAGLNGLKIPVVWNSSGFEKAEVIQALEGIVDVYLPDLKFISSENALHVSGRKDYFEFALPAVKEMFRQVGTLKFDEDGIALRGVLIRHLVLPENVSDSRDIIDKVRGICPELNMSVMSQYFPAHKAMNDKKLSRKITRKEYDDVLEFLHEIKFEDVYIQDM